MSPKHTNFEAFSLASALGDRLRSRDKLTEPLPGEWLKLLAKLDEVDTPTQPKQEDGENDDAAS